MKKSRSATRIISVFVLIFGFVAMMCMFADAFAGENGCPRGNLFNVMFGLREGMNPVALLIVGFAFVVLLMISGLAGIIVGEASGKTLAFTNIALGVVAGVLFLLSMVFYGMSNPQVDMAATADNALGSGSITVAIFSFLAAGFGVIDLLVHSKK
ncbi:MAG: hypothetical protein MJ228_04885 [Bacilli bacterium]|nr:hypothetical protein [Bacilli bacterium]